MKRIFLSPPWVDRSERECVSAAFDSGYVAPCGPMVEEFERELSRISGRRHAVAVASGTAALDLIMEDLGVDGSWTVIAPTLTFIATIGPAFHRGAKLVFVDSDATGNIDTALLARALGDLSRVKGKTLVIPVDLYGRVCKTGEISALCRLHGAAMVCDSAEAVGAIDLEGRPAGKCGLAGIYSFNGNKIVTTSGGGAVVTDSKRLADHVRKLSQQSRENKIWYEHKEVGFNYRMSNIVAAIGLAQIRKLPEILAKREANFRFYRSLEESGASLKIWDSVPGENHWLTIASLPSRRERDSLIRRFGDACIESRPVWKPMHLQSVFRNCRIYGGSVAEDLFLRGICLPSGSGLEKSDLARIAACIR
ncbi:MAG: DegT/DnrJ/EryC1/StrS family aminotransferase [Kiritimatiellae bacterium]|nr:DegT/DnrJ/EryC1/StrS family aminotransferase [Kiritimatiellia bacterium]